MKGGVFFILFLILFCACSSISEKQADKILSMVDEKDKNFEDISADTVVLATREYFINTNNIEKAAMACFYCGRVYQMREEFDRSMKFYAEAEYFAEKTGDYDLMGTIRFFMGTMYYTQLLTNEAIEKLKSSLELTRKVFDNYNREMAIYNIIGNSYLITNQTDSSLNFYNVALQLAESHKDSIYLSSIKGNISMVYIKMGDIKTAKNYLKEAIDLNKDEPARLYFNLAKLFYEENIKDSVIYYTDIALNLTDKENNNKLKSNIYNLLSKMEEKNGNYKSALAYKEQYLDHFASILEEKSNNDILIIENKYNYEQAQNINNQLLIKQQYTLLIVLILIILLIVFYFYFYRKINIQKTHTLKLEKASLEAEQQMQALKSMAKSFNEKEKSLRTEVLSHFEILKKVALLKEDNQLNDRTNYKRSPLERINDIVYGDQTGYNWDTFFDSISNLYSETIDKINHSFSDLDTTERKVCYLDYMEFSNSEMSILLGYSLRGVELKKTNIRKKLSIPDRGSIKTFLSNYLDQSNM
jgi:tetratricopeptide (TPR) repeat protein